MDIKNIFITGGTGFIGTRFIQKCILDWDYKITALVRDYSRLSRLARFENGTIKYQFGEINKLDTLNEIENVDAVVHFAFDLSSIKKNIIGIKNITKES